MSTNRFYKRTFEELVEKPILLLITEFKNYKGISIAMSHSQSVIASKSLETCVYLNPLSDLAIYNKLIYKAFLIPLQHFCCRTPASRMFLFFPFGSLFHSFLGQPGLCVRAETKKGLASRASYMYR